MRIDLNSDLGESFGPWPMGQDAALMDSITSANIACGFHAGDPGAMRQTVALAKDKGVAIGAHPGFPDLVGFGRREMKATPTEVEDFVLYQVAALAGAIARGVAAFDRSLILFGLPNSELLRAGAAAGLPVAAEVFADRAYERDGSLVSRQKNGSVIHDQQTVVERAVRMVKEKEVVAVDGSTIALQADTICLHGDTPGAADLARG